MFQRLKNKKGFTLIELIVVIAILGILALIAIPRFAGFTDRAKIRADEQYGALVGNALVVMLAAEDYTTTTNVVFDVTGSTGAVALASGQTLAGFSQTELELLVLRKPLQYFTSMQITMTDDGEHWISRQIGANGSFNIAQDGTKTVYTPQP